MPVPIARDDDATRAALQRWFDRQPDGGGRQVLPGLEVPQGAGNANETILFAAARGTEAGGPDAERFVLRIAPREYDLFMDSSLADQVALLRALREHTGLPVPRVPWYEPDEEFFGAQFCVMERAPGRVPPDREAVASWTRELTVEQRRRLWENGFDALCSIHTAPGRDAVESLLARGLDGRTGLRAELDRWGRYRAWGGVADERLDRVHDWLVAHEPAEPTTSLSWGDARLENLVFGDDLQVTAILDWEMASLGGPLMDLAWWLMSDRFVAQARLTGYGDRAESLARWVERTGVGVAELPWYEVFSAYRLGAICARIVALNAARGIDLSRYDLVSNALRTADDVLGTAAG